MTTAATEPWLREYEGPRCPCCYRNDGSHNEACPLPAYLSAWKKIRKEAVDEYVEAVLPHG
jgi:hypothetical protein